MPTLDAANHRRAHGAAGGLGILTSEGQILPEVYQVLAMIREADAILGTGHLSVAESVMLVKEARRLGLRKILVTHPEAPFVGMSVEVQREISGRNTYFERCLVNTTKPAGGPKPIAVADIAAQVSQVGVGSTVLSTDFGQQTNSSPTEGMRSYLSGMLEAGLRPADLRVMAAENPAYLLGL